MTSDLVVFLQYPEPHKRDNIRSVMVVAAGVELATNVALRGVARGHHPGLISEIDILVVLLPR